MYSEYLQDVHDIEGLELVVEHHIVKGRCNWYKKHRHFPWLWFRGVGIVTIVSSISIPFLVKAGGEYMSLWAPVAALSVAVLTSLNAFFAWHKSWEKRVRVWLTIESYIAIWETKIVEAKSRMEMEERFQMALKATRELIENTNRLEIEEAAALSVKFKSNVLNGDTN